MLIAEPMKDIAEGIQRERARREVMVEGEEVEGTDPGRW